MRNLIYCLEDDNNIRDMVVYALKTAGFEAEGFDNAVGFYKRVAHQVPALAILDIMLPGEDGISVLKNLKKTADTRDVPVIMLTAKSTEYDKIVGLDSGADDYVSKPFGVMELISRVKAVLRRASHTETDNKKEIAVGNVVLNTDYHTVMVGNQNIILTLKEFELLKCLMENHGIVLTREKIMLFVWGCEFEGETRTVDMHVKTLRQKLGESGNIIETVRGVGYKIGGLQ